MPANDPPSDLRRWVNRATFGAPPALLEEVMSSGWEGWVNALLAPDEKADTDCLKRLKNLRLHIQYDVQPVVLRKPHPLRLRKGRAR